MLKRICSFIFCVAMVQSTSAQKYVFLNYNVDNGLAHSQVRSLYQDSRGVLWIGSLGGVTAFDGQEFINYGTSDGLINNEVGAITQLENEALVFGSINGITIYNRRSFTRHAFKAELKGAAVNQLVTSGDSLLIATEKGLVSYKKGNLSYYDYLLPEDDQNVKALSFRETGLYMLTKNAIYQWSNKGVDKLTTAKNMAETLGALGFSFMDMVIDDSGHFFITTSNQGLIEAFDNQVLSLSVEDGLVSNVLNTIYKDDKGDLLICSKNGLSHIRENDLTSFTEANGLDFSDVRAVIKDYEGRYWIGTNGGGLYKFCGYSFTYFTTDEGLSSNAVMTISKGEDGDLAFGTFDNGISKYTNGEWEYVSGDRITNNKVWTSEVDGNGNLWFGTTGGIDVLSDGVPLKKVTTKNGLDYNKTTALCYDSMKNVMWAGTSRGLNAVYTDSVMQLSSFKANRIRALELSPSGDLLIGTRQGAWVYNGSDFTEINGLDHLEDKTVYCLKAQGENTWIGTKSGLFLASADSTYQVKLSGSFLSNTINFLETDPDGNLWVGTNLGLFQIDRERNIKSFSKQDGLVNLETNLNAVFNDGKHLWFGTSTALQRLNYSDLKQSQTLKPPKTILKEVRLNLEKTDWSEKGSSFLLSSPVPLSPEVSYKNNNFSFKYHAVSVEEASNIEYQYYLEGFDNTWQPVTKNATATYTNLPYSDLTFKVQAKRTGEQWGQVLSYPFRIVPPFWQTWWFITTAVLLTLILGFQIFQYRRRNLITALEKEKFEIKSKMLALEQQSLNSSMNRHFIFNALNSIQYYINRQDRLSANRYLSSFAKLIRKNLDSSQTNFTSLSDEIERLNLYLEIENMRFKDKFDYEINVSDDIDEELVEIPSMLLQPYLENSIWHGILPQDKKGDISVDITKNELNQMEIRIKDNGIGITTSQAKKNGKAEHISKGMNITSGRIELLKKITAEKVTLIGPFELKSIGGDVLGTQVTIKLPMEYNN